MKYPHLASRIFGVPLLIERHKLDVILSVLVYGPGDPGTSGKQRKPYFVTADGIAVIEIIGPLVKRAVGDFMSGGPTTYAELENEFMDAATDPAIKGVMLLVDSPGGESAGAMELADLVYSQRGSKPIYAVADGDAFSAAYALASAADRLYVSKSSGVGSVGVWMMHVDQSAYDAKEGIKPTLIFAGAHKVDGNPFEPLSADARATFQAEVDRTYAMFVSTVARNRGLSAAAVRKTEAALYFGQNGVDVGFADQLGTFADAMAALTARVKGVNSMSPIPISLASAPVPAQSAESVESMVSVSVAAAASAPVPVPSVESVKSVDNSSRSAVLAYAAEVAELCALAVLPAAEYIRSGKPLEEIRTEVQNARAAAELEIHAAVLPSTGADNPRQAARRGPKTEAEIAASPIVKAAEKLAAESSRN